MQCLICGYLLADLDDFIETKKHSLPFVLVCNLGWDIRQQGKAFFQGKHEMLIG